MVEFCGWNTVEIAIVKTQSNILERLEVFVNRMGKELNTNPIICPKIDKAQFSDK
jgi:hypothetical protein